MPPSANATIGDIANAIATSQLNRFTECYVPTADSTEKLIDTFNRAFPQASRNAILSNGSTVKTYLCVNADGTPGIINHAIWTTGVNYEQIVAFNRGDAFNDVNPAYAPPTEFTEYFLSLTTRHDTMVSHLHHSDHDVMVSTGPTGDPADPARFHWPNSIEAVDQPRITALPKLFPIPLGLALPDTPTWTKLLALASAFPLLGTWVKAVRFLQDHHGGTTLNSNDVLLQWSTVDATAFDGLSLATSLPISLTWFTPADAGHKEVRERAKIGQNMAYLQYAEGEPAPAQAGAPAPAPLALLPIAPAVLINRFLVLALDDYNPLLSLYES